MSNTPSNFSNEPTEWDTENYLTITVSNPNLNGKEFEVDFMHHLLEDYLIDAYFDLADLLDLFNIGEDQYDFLALAKTHDLLTVYDKELGFSIQIISTNGVLWLEELTGQKLISTNPDVSGLFRSTCYRNNVELERKMVRNIIEQKMFESSVEDIVNMAVLPVQKVRGLTLQLSTVSMLLHGIDLSTVHDEITLSKLNQAKAILDIDWRNFVQPVTKEEEELLVTVEVVDLDDNDIEEDIEVSDSDDTDEDEVEYVDSGY